MAYIFWTDEVRWIMALIWTNDDGCFSSCWIEVTITEAQAHGGCTPLEEAIRRGAPDLASLLRSRDGDAEIRDPGGSKPLQRVFSVMHEFSVELANCGPWSQLRLWE